MRVGSNMRCPMSLVRHLWLALALLVAIGPSASAQTTEAVDAVTAALRAGDFGQAAERSRVALTKAPNDARLWTLNGLALAGVGRRAEALRSFERALTIDPNYLAALEGAASREVVVIDSEGQACAELPPPRQLLALQLPSR